MRCPFCDYPDTSVKDSRVLEDQSVIKRRRSCPTCKGRFTTFERPHLKELTVVKKNGRRIPFDRERLSRSISTAIHKNSLNAETIDQIVSAITKRLETSGESEISTKQIGELVLLSLLKLDPVAYIRFASIYQEFNSIRDFATLIKKFDSEEAVRSAEDQMTLSM